MTENKPHAKRIVKAIKPTAQEPSSGEAASRLIDAKIRELDDWRGRTLARMRELILSVDAGIVEECKWRGTPVWSHHGILCTGETYKTVVKLTFAKGAKLADPKGLFNSSLEGNTRRAIDIHEGEQVNAAAFKTLIKAAIALNAGSAKTTNPATKKAAPKSSTPAEIPILSESNSQMGEEPLQSYIATLSNWKHEPVTTIDRLISHQIPAVCKKVMWGELFYGLQGQGWFLYIVSTAKELRVVFPLGLPILSPTPPGREQRHKNACWLEINEGDVIDRDQLTMWIKQAASHLGWDHLYWFTF